MLVAMGSAAVVDLVEIDELRFADRAITGLLSPLLRREHIGADGILGLGADVPMCLASKPLRVRGIGEGLEPVALPDIPAVLVNGRISRKSAANWRYATAAAGW